MSVDCIRKEAKPATSPKTLEELDKLVSFLKADADIV